MKINEYNEMMAYLTKPDKKPVIPKSKPKKSTREAYKEYLEIRPFLDAESQMFIEKELGFADGGRIGFDKGGSVALAKILNELPDGTEVTRDMVQKIIDDNNLDVTVRNFFARPSTILKEGITLSKRMSPIKITDELLKSVDNYIKNTPLNLKQIGEDLGYKPTEKGQSGQLRSTSPLIKEYEAKYGKIPEGRFKPYKLTEGSDYVQNIIKLREELGSTNAVSKQLKLDNKTIRNALKAGNRFDLIGDVNVRGPETGAKAIKKRAKEVIKEAEKKAGPKTTKQAKEVIQGIADRNKIYANMSAEELAKDKNFLRRLRLRINPNSGAVDFTGYTEANPVRGKVFSDIELAQHAIDKAKKGELIAPDHITPKRFRKQNVGYPINFQPATYMENSQFENAKKYLINNPTGNVAPINSYLKANNKTIRFGKNKYGYTGNIVFNAETGNQTLLDFEKRINVGRGVTLGSNFANVNPELLDFRKLPDDVSNLYRAASATAAKSPATLNALRKARAAAKFTGLGLAGEAAFTAPFALSNYAAGKSGKRILGDATYGLFGQTENEELRKATGELGFATKTLDDLSTLLPAIEAKYNTFNDQNDPRGEKRNQFKNLYEANVKKYDDNLSLFTNDQGEFNTDLYKQAVNNYKAGVMQIQKFDNIAKQQRADIRTGLEVPDIDLNFFSTPIANTPAYDFAGGGIAKMGGVSSGPAPKSGPTPQGLDFLLKRGR